MKASNFRSLVKWFGIFAVVHLISFFIFDFILGGILVQLAEDNLGASNLAFYIFSVVVNLVVVFMYARMATSFVDYRKQFRQISKEDSFSLLSYYKEKHLKLHLTVVALYAIFQLPFCISYALQGFVHEQLTLLECLFVCDAGAYLLTGNAILGLILNALTFCVSLCGVFIFMLWLMKRDIEEF